MSEWKLLKASTTAHVHLPMTLCGGQCFRWRPTPRQTYVGVIHDRVFELRQAQAAQDVHGGGAVEYRRLNPASLETKKKQRHSPLQKPSDDESVLVHYLALDVNIQQLWDRWSTHNPHQSHPLVRHLVNDTMQVEAQQLRLRNENKKGGKVGTPRKRATPEDPPCIPIRVLRQDVHETLLSFLCSQNNHVRRITEMVESLGRLYGTPLCETHLDSGGTRPPSPRAPTARSASRATKKDAETEAEGWVTLYALPSAAELAAKATEEVLRQSGYGYRSKYIVQSMKQIVSARGTATDPRSHISPLVRLQHPLASQVPFYAHLLALDSAAAQREELLQLQGVGRKVADCVLLFGLDRTDIVPVDTHMAQLAAVYLEPQRAATPAAPLTPGTKRSRSPTPKVVTAENWQGILAQWKEKERDTTTKKTRREKGGDADAKAKAKRAAAVPPLASIHHDAIQKGFEVLFGQYCGWAHSILFYYHMTRKL